jgi:hypothetical protein
MPFCKYCYSSGLKRKIYTNHNTFVKINNEKRIECKNLAKTQCKKCKQIGHTSKYCIVAVNHENEEDSQENIDSEIAAIESIRFVYTIFTTIFICYGMAYAYIFVFNNITLDD